jgi:hypothetical protein
MASDAHVKIALVCRGEPLVVLHVQLHYPCCQHCHGHRSIASHPAGAVYYYITNTTNYSSCELCMSLLSALPQPSQHRLRPCKTWLTATTLRRTDRDSSCKLCPTQSTSAHLVCLSSRCRCSPRSVTGSAAPCLAPAAVCAPARLSRGRWSRCGACRSCCLCRCTCCRAACATETASCKQQRQHDGWRALLEMPQAAASEHCSRARDRHASEAAVRRVAENGTQQEHEGGYACATEAAAMLHLYSIVLHLPAV